MRLNELLDQQGPHDFDNLSSGSFIELLDIYCSELNAYSGDAIEILKKLEELPKGVTSCIKKASFLLQDLSHNALVCPPFSTFCSLLSALLLKMPGKRLLYQHCVLLLQSVAKIVHSLSSSNLFKSLFSVPPSSRHLLYEENVNLANLARSIIPLSSIISLALELGTIILLSNSNKADGRVANYIHLLEFAATYGPALPFIRCADLDDIQIESMQTQMLAMVEKIIPSSILHILTHRASTLRVGTLDVSVSSELKRLIAGIKKCIFSMYSLSVYAKRYEANEIKQDKYPVSESSESYNEETDQKLDDCTTDYTTNHYYSDINAIFSMDEIGFLRLYANTGLSTLNKAIITFIISTLRKDSMDGMKQWLGELYSFPNPSGRQVTTLAVLLVEKMFSRGLKSYAPLSDFLSDLSELYFMMNDMSVSVRIIDIFVEIQESGPVGRDYIKTVLYRSMLRNRLSAASVCRKQSIYLLQALFPISEETELISLDIDSLIAALGDNDTTVQEAAMACSVTILSKYYDCMPFAGRSKLLSNLLESAFDISPTIRYLAINGLVELHKVPSLRADISSFAYNNREKLSLLLLDSAHSTHSTELSAQTPVQQAYIRFVCNVAHDAALLSTSDASETSSSAPQYKILTISMRLFYCVIYTHLIIGNSNILSSIFPTPTQTILNARGESNVDKEGAESPSSDALLPFLHNVIVSMGYLSGPLLTAVIKYFVEDIDSMKQPETRLLGYAAVLKTLLSLTCYVYDIINASMKDNEMVEYVVSSHATERNGGQREVEYAESIVEFYNPLTILLQLIVEIYNYLLVEQDSISRPNLRVRRRDMTPLIKDITKDWCSGCNIKLLTFLKEMLQKGALCLGSESNVPFYIIVLSFNLQKLIVQLDCALSEDGSANTSLFEEGRSIEFPNAAFSFSQSLILPYTLQSSSLCLEFLCQTQGLALVDPESFDHIDLSSVITEKKDYDINDILPELSNATCYKKIIIRYYSRNVLDATDAVNTVKETMISIVQLLVTIHSIETDNEGTYTEDHVARLILVCCSQMWSALCHLYTYWLVSSEDALPKDTREIWTGCVNVIMFSCIYLFRLVHYGDLRDASTIISDGSYSIASILAMISIDAIIISLLINVDASCSLLAVQIIVHLHNYFMESDAHSNSFTLRAICINNEGVLGRVFSTEELESGSATVASLVLQKCISAMLDQADARCAEREKCVLCVVSKLIASMASFEGSTLSSDLRDAIFTSMEPDPKKPYYDLLLLAGYLDPSLK